MIRAYVNPLGEESSDFENIKADKKIINLIISAFLESAENVLTEKEKSCLTFAGEALSLLQCIRFLTDYLKNDIYYKTTYKNQNWVRGAKSMELILFIKKYLIYIFAL